MSIDLGVFVWNYIPQCVGYTSMSAFACVRVCDFTSRQLHRVSSSWKIFEGKLSEEFAQCHFQSSVAFVFIVYYL